jgi:aminoglycoside phosphotransferase (APT) family kinase protein
VRRLHDGEVDIDVKLVRRLLVTQFPELCDYPLEEVHSTGTVNAMYRLGGDLCVRLPRVERWAADLMKELEWLPRLAPHVSLAVPEPLHEGQAGSGYPYTWAIYSWIAGNTYEPGGAIDDRDAAADVAQFVLELRAVDPSGGPPSGRLPLRQLEAITRRAINSLTGVADIAAVTDAWERSLRAPVWDGRPVWRHCDLLPPNVLVEKGRLRAVIDFGGVGVGDPALDVIPAWTMFSQPGRLAFRAILDVDDGTWARARGFALHQALLIIPYYAETNPEFVDMATRTVAEVIADLSGE